MDKIAAPPLSLPVKLPRDAQSSSDDGDEADNDILLQKCIRDGIQTTTRSNEDSVGANTSSSGIGKIGPLRTLPNHVKENPIGMLRKGGNSYIESVLDETSRFNVEDSPCNFSVGSGLSELTIASNTPSAFNCHRFV